MSNLPTCNNTLISALLTHTFCTFHTIYIKHLPQTDDTGNISATICKYASSTMMQTVRKIARYGKQSLMYVIWMSPKRLKANSANKTRPYPVSRY